MTGELSVHGLWESAPASGRTLEPGRLAGLPEAARRYLEHAIAPGAPLASAVRLRMHGEIRLGRWFPFTGEQVIRRDWGMIWRATVRMWGVPVRGFGTGSVYPDPADSARAVCWILCQAAST
jgi:uncharacterized protein DUF6544